MATATVTGNVRDLQFVGLNDRSPELVFEIDEQLVTQGAGNLLVAEPAKVTPASSGAFSIDLQESLGTNPYIPYKVTVRWISQGMPREASSDSWRVVVPRGGGAIANMIAVVTPSQIITRGEPGMDGNASPITVAAAKAAAEAAIADADLVNGSDPRLPNFGSAPEVIAAVRDAAGRETWLGARTLDGGPTNHAMRHIGRRAGLEQLESAEYLLALTDANRRVTDLAIRASDGQFADFVVDRLRRRILNGNDSQVAALRSYADTKYTPGAEVFPVHTDTKRAAGWGSSSMAGIDAGLSTLFAGKGAAYYPGGKGSEVAQQIAARMGSVPALLTVVGGSIPASGTVSVQASNVPTSSALKPFTGTLAGVPGTLAYRTDVTPGVYGFTRTNAGSAQSVPAGTPFIPDAASYRDAVTLLWMGKNNLGAAGADTLVVKLTDESFDWLAPLAKRCLVLGHFVDVGTPENSLERSQIAAVNEAHRKRYGRLYIDIAEYLAGPQVWADTKITPTAADLTAQSTGTKPPSLSRDNWHLNDAGNAAVTQLINARMTELGWT